MKRKPIMEFYPLVPVCFVMIGGIALGDYFHDTAAEWYYWLGTSVIMYLVVLATFGVESFRKKKARAKTRKLPAPSLAIDLLRTIMLLMATGVLGFSLILLSYDRHTLTLPEDIQKYEAVVISEPEEHGKIVRFDMTVLTGPLSGRSVRASLQKDSLSSIHKNIKVGTGLIVRSRFMPLKNFKDSNFDYVRYLLGKDIDAQTFIPDGRWTSEAVSLSSLSHLERTKIAALRFRHDILEKYCDIGLDEDTYSLAAAMTFGDKSKLSSDVEDTFSLTGVAHILSLSGLHLSVIYALLCFFTFSKRRSLWRELILLLAVWSFVMIAGSKTPLVRSALMITIYSIVSVSERNPLSLNVLAFTALIMLVANPLCLFDIGFQLSFFAIGSILLLHKPVVAIIPERYLKFRLLRWIWHIVVISTVAQLGTAPLVAYYFGRLPVYFLLANIIAVPLTTLILYVSVVILLFAYIPLLGSVLATILAFIVEVLNGSMSFIASLPCASIENIHINGSQVFWSYVAILAICLFIRRTYRALFPPRLYHPH